MVGDQLSTVVAEIRKIRIISSDHIMEFDFTFFHRLDKACFGEGMPIERRILFNPEFEMIRRYRKRNCTRQTQTETAGHKRGTAFKAEPISFVGILDDTIP